MKRLILLILFVVMAAPCAQASPWVNEDEFINYDYVGENDVLTWELSIDYPVYGTVADIHVTSTVFLDDPYPRIEIKMSRVWNNYNASPGTPYELDHTLYLGSLPQNTPFHIEYSQTIKTWESSYVAGFSYGVNFKVIEGNLPTIATPEAVPLLSMGLGLLFIWGMNRRPQQWGAI